MIFTISKRQIVSQNWKPICLRHLEMYVPHSGSSTARESVCASVRLSTCVRARERESEREEFHGHKNPPITNRNQECLVWTQD